MKQLILLIALFCITFISIAQAEYDKDDFIGTWRTCGDVNWDDNADTLIFQKATPGCREHNCGEHDWSFRTSGLIEFIFTSGCDTGFISKSKNPKKWMYHASKNRLMFVTNDGWKEYFDVLELGDQLILVHRKDLED